MKLKAQVFVTHRSETQMILSILCDNGDELSIDIGGPSNTQELELCKRFGFEHDARISASVTIDHRSISAMV
jgi:hypothetical protein